MSQTCTIRYFISKGVKKQCHLLDTESGTSSLECRNDTLFAVGSEGLVLYDITDPLEPTPLSIFRTTYPALSLTMAGDLLILSSGLGGVDIISLSYGPRLRSHIDPRERTFAAAYDAGRMFIADGYAGISEYDLADVDDPTFIGGFYSTEQAVDVKLQDDRLYVADYYGVHRRETGR